MVRTTITTNVHVGDAPFRCERRADTIGGPYYVLKVGSDATLFLEPKRLADLLAVVQPCVEAEAAAGIVERAA